MDLYVAPETSLLDVFRNLSSSLDRRRSELVRYRRDEQNPEQFSYLKAQICPFPVNSNLSGPNTKVDVHVSPHLHLDGAIIDIDGNQFVSVEYLALRKVASVALRGNSKNPNLSIPDTRGVTIYGKHIPNKDLGDLFCVLNFLRARNVRIRPHLHEVLFQTSMGTPEFTWDNFS